MSKIKSKTNLSFNFLSATLIFLTTSVWADDLFLQIQQASQDSCKIYVKTIQDIYAQRGFADAQKAYEAKVADLSKDVPPKVAYLNQFLASIPAELRERMKILAYSSKNDRDDVSDRMKESVMVDLKNLTAKFERKYAQAESVCAIHAYEYQKFELSDDQTTCLETKDNYAFIRTEKPAVRRWKEAYELDAYVTQAGDPYVAVRELHYSVEDGHDQPLYQQDGDEGSLGADLNRMISQTPVASAAVIAQRAGHEPHLTEAQFVTTHKDLPAVCKKSPELQPFVKEAQSDALTKSLDALIAQDQKQPTHVASAADAR